VYNQDVNKAPAFGIAPPNLSVPDDGVIENENSAQTGSFSFDISDAPEPSTCALLLGGLAALAYFTGRRSTKPV
jgi:hypothetical protein